MKSVCIPLTLVDGSFAPRRNGTTFSPRPFTA